MDLMDFEGEHLYFEEALAPEVEALVSQAAGRYAEGTAEPPLLEALRQAPESLNVLVAAYRYYYYQHRLDDALGIARRALAVTAGRLDIPLDWQSLTSGHLRQGGPAKMALLRFHLLSLKAQAYLLLRQGGRDEGRAILAKLLELDSHNRLGARQLLEVADSVALEPT